MTESGARPERRGRGVPDTLRWGVGLAFGAALISGFSIFINGFAVKQVPDAAIFTTLKNGVAALILVSLALGVGGARSFRALDRSAWTRLAVIGVVGGSVPFLLFFGGLAQASAPSAAFIHKTLFVWVAVLAVPFLGERLGWAQLAALAVLLVGQFIVVPPDGVAWGTGETMIAAATLLWSIEVVIARRLLAGSPVSAPVAAAGRLGLGMIVLVGFLAVTGRLAPIAALTPVQWAWSLGTGVILAGYVATWYAALKRAPASLVTAVLVVGAPITATITAIGKGALPDATILVGQGLILAAVAALAVLAVRARTTTPASTTESARA